MVLGTSVGTNIESFPGGEKPKCRIGRFCRFFRLKFPCLLLKDRLSLVRELIGNCSEIPEADPNNSKPWMQQK
jgi:hypothetical protein